MSEQQGHPEATRVSGNEGLDARGGLPRPSLDHEQQQPQRQQIYPQDSASLTTNNSMPSSSLRDESSRAPFNQTSLSSVRISLDKPTLEAPGGDEPPSEQESPSNPQNQNSLDGANHIHSPRPIRPASLWPGMASGAGQQLQGEDREAIFSREIQQELDELRGALVAHEELQEPRSEADSQREVEKSQEGSDKHGELEELRGEENAQSEQANSQEKDDVQRELEQLRGEVRALDHAYHDGQFILRRVRREDNTSAVARYLHELDDAVIKGEDDELEEEGRALRRASNKMWRRSRGRPEASEVADSATAEEALKSTQPPDPPHPPKSPDADDDWLLEELMSIEPYEEETELPALRDDSDEEMLDAHETASIIEDPVKERNPNKYYGTPRMDGLPNRAIFSIMARFDSIKTLGIFTSVFSRAKALARQHLHEISAGISLESIHPDNMDIALVAVKLFRFPWNAVRSSIEFVCQVCDTNTPEDALREVCRAEALYDMADMMTSVNTLVAHYMSGPRGEESCDEYWTQLRERFRKVWPPRKREEAFPWMSSRDQQRCRHIAMEFWRGYDAYFGPVSKFCPRDDFAEFGRVQREFLRYELQCRNKMLLTLVDQQRYNTGTWVCQEKPGLMIMAYFDSLQRAIVHCIGMEDRTRALHDAQTYFQLRMLGYQHLQDSGVYWGYSVLEVGPRVGFSDVWR